MNMRQGGEQFRFKNFVVQHDRCAMRVTTDAILLGSLIAHWLSSYDGKKKVLDVGTGCGILSLMLAQESGAEITALEIDKEAAEQAAENIEHSEWQERIQSIHQSFQEYMVSGEQESYDSIVSNPPFFPTPHPVKQPPNTEPHRAVARFEDSLPFPVLIEGVVKLLKPTGCFTVIVPYARAVEFTGLAGANGLFLFNQMDIIYKARKPVGRSVLRFAKQRVPFTYESLTLHDVNGRHTPEFAALTHNFYL